MSSWLTLGAVLFAAYGGLGLSACADGVYLGGGLPARHLDARAAQAEDGPD